MAPTTAGAASTQPPADVESQEKLLKQRILDGMAKVFAGLARTSPPGPAVQA